MRRVVPALLALLVLMGFGLLAWELSRSRTVQVFGDLVSRIETERRVVALTFDDGPTRDGVAVVLPILDSLDVKATFFVTGSEVAANPESARAIVEAGHELGNHSFSHRRMVLKTPGFVRSELDRTDSLIVASGQSGETFFRPPFSKKLLVLPWVLSRSGRTSVTWDVEPESPPGAWQDAGEILRHTLASARPGSIILLHVMYPSRSASRAALPGIITELRERGFDFVTLRELIRGSDLGAGEMPN